ncbi:hypothetical protein RND71_019080 [Anisodus tanguticus]|uniref:Uncharacterized protein n=1 Tax=Anisodus tanguticus TaxID=243964 RepID=A0AAE1V862_9SOLA|nr:hypothetical protein RND71_019080 [Anisodus tanguticus]
MEIVLQGGRRDSSRAMTEANDTCPWGPEAPARVGKRTAGACVASSRIRLRGVRVKLTLSHDGLNPTHVPYWWVNNPTLGELLHNDRKSEDRRIKKQRRYERLAATSRLSTVDTALSFNGCAAPTKLPTTMSSAGSAREAKGLGSKEGGARFRFTE